MLNYITLFFLPITFNAVFFYTIALCFLLLMTKIIYDSINKDRQVFFYLKKYHDIKISLNHLPFDATGQRKSTIAHLKKSKWLHRITILTACIALISGVTLLSLFSYGQLLQGLALAFHFYLSVGWNMVWQANYLWCFTGNYFAFYAITVGLIMIAKILQANQFNIKSNRLATPIRLPIRI